MAREKRSVLAPHTWCHMVVVIANWQGDAPVVIGAVEDSLFQAYTEEGKWEDFKRDLAEGSGMEEAIDHDTVREVKVDTWIPFLWDPPLVKPDEPHAKPMDPDLRFSAAVAALKRREDEADARSDSGDSGKNLLALGEKNGLQTAREMLQTEVVDDEA